VSAAPGRAAARPACRPARGFCPRSAAFPARPSGKAPSPPRRAAKCSRRLLRNTPHTPPPAGRSPLPRPRRARAPPAAQRAAQTPLAVRRHRRRLPPCRCPLCSPVLRPAAPPGARRCSQRARRALQPTRGRMPPSASSRSRGCGGTCPVRRGRARAPPARRPPSGLLLAARCWRRAAGRCAAGCVGLGTPHAASHSHCRSALPRAPRCRAELPLGWATSRLLGTVD
jgi:hypothetical protein